jgi:hypothetical protein
LPGVQEIASVSNCIAKGVEIDVWRLNELGFLNDVGLAESFVPQTCATEFDVYGYRLLDERFKKGSAEAWTVPQLGCAPPGAEFERLGFDAVSKFPSNFFECSPLSCNGAARVVRANAYCLLDSLEEAVVAAKDFSAGPWEPGTYYIAEVLRRRRRTSR